MTRERKNKVDERTALAIGVCGGILCGLSGASPTGTGAVDFLMLAVSGFLVSWAGASASWWVVGVASAIAAATVQDPFIGIVAVIGFGIAVYIGVKKRNLPELRSLAAAFAVNALARSELGGFLGLSAIIGIGVGVFVIVWGMQRRPSKVRAAAEIGFTVIGVSAIIAIVGFAVAAATARGPISDGNNLAKQGLSAVNRGDFDQAADYFESATRAFVRADDQLNKPWGKLAKVVPVVSQHYDAANSLTSAAADATSTLVNSVRSIDIDSLTVADGKVDLETVASLADPFADLKRSVDDLQTAVNGADSQWLLGAVRDELTALRTDLRTNGLRLDNAISAIELAPAMLGGDGDRHYLVLFTTPAEARGSGGFPGNYGLITTSQGAIELSRFGRVDELKAEVTDQTKLTGPPGFLDQFRPYVLDADGKVAPYAWGNITMPPSFPMAAQAAAELFAQTGGRPVDGVIMVDPFALQALLRFTGPITIDGFDQRLTADNAADVLLKEQYLIPDKDERLDFIDQAGRKIFDKLLTGSLPSPVVLARDLGPLAVDGRLRMWTDVEDEQDLLAKTYLLGELPTFDGHDGIAVTVDNVGGNKIDTYLQREITYDSQYELSTGLTRGDLTLRLTNSSPASGLPFYVIGNIRDLPLGTNQMRLCLYSPLLLDSIEIDDGDDVGFTSSTANGLNVYCRTVVVPSQGTVTISARFFGDLPETDLPAEIWEQPLVNDLVITAPVASDDAAPDDTAG